MKNPGRTIPLALVLSVLICFLIYGGLQFAFTGALAPGDLAKGWGALALPGDLGPLSAIAAALGLLWLVSLLNFGAVIGPFGGGLVAVGSNARLAFALAENGFFPKLFATISARGVPLAALLLNLAFAVLAFVLLPFDEVVQLNSAAIILSFAVGPVAVVALRSLLPDAHRPLRIPGVFFVALAAFVVATLIIYWSGWDTVWRLGICLAIGLALFLANARARMTRDLDVREALWLVPYLLGIAIVSYLGAFGGRGIIPFGTDMAILTLLAALVFAYALRSRLPREKFDRYMREEQVLETLSADAPIGPLATPGEVRG